MTHSSLFSPNNHIRHSHYLQPDSLAPPHSGSFSRSGGFKSSLRKIPSALFSKEKTPVKQKPSKSKLQIYRDSPSRSMKHEVSRVGQPSSVVSETGTTTAVATINKDDKVKNKKPRKALADLFGWSNHNHTQPQPISPQPIKLTAAPPVPPKDPQPVMLKKIGRPPSTKSTNSHVSSLRPPIEPVMAARPSMGDDPFQRSGQGAEVVEHVLRHGTQSPSVRSITLDRRASIASSKALSTKTISHDGHSTKDLTGTDRDLSSVRPQNGQRHVSAPMPAQVPLTELPPRSASLGRLLGSSTVATALPDVPESPIEAEEEIKTLKREKTKSRVWGFLGRNKSKKTKDQVDPEPPVPVAREPWTRPAAPLGGLSLAAQIDDKIAAATIKTHNGSIKAKNGRTRPPVLHISGPSFDMPVSMPLNTASTTSFPSTAVRRAFDDGDTSPQSMPSKYPISSGRGGVWESIVGSNAQRPSEDGTRHAIEALMGSSRLPKRKSLSGLFGLPIKKSMEKIKSSSPPRVFSNLFHHRVEASPPRIAAEPTLKPLSEEIEEASAPFQASMVPSEKFFSRFEEITKPNEPPPSRHDHGLRRVASATDKLFNLVTCLDFSPTSSRSPTLHHMGSLNSLRQGFNGSPTPVRRIRSAMLSQKASGSSLKPPSINVSPLKFALQRAQAAASHKSNEPFTSPPRESLVRKGMRNVFAPPSPAPPKHGKPSKPSNDLAAVKVMDERVGMGQTMGPSIVEERNQSIKGSLASDVPADLKALIQNIDVAQTATSPNKRSTLGLPAPPPSDRISPRRPPPPPPALSLPPVPESSSVDLSESTPVPFESETRAEPSPKESVFSDMLTVTHNGLRDSFDFTNEYAALDQGAQRASFVEALKKVSSLQMLVDTAASPLPVIPLLPSPQESGPESIPSFHVSKPSDDTSHVEDSDDEDEEGDFGDDDAFEDAVEIAHVVGIAKTSPVRREPFRGQFAFQQHVNTMKRQTSHGSFGAPEPIEPLSETAPAAVALPLGHRRGHQRGESGLSIATMSSIGSVIGSGNEREYTNYFEVNFSNHLAHSRQHSVAETIAELSDETSPRRSISRDSMRATAPLGPRPTTRRAHHRRNSSIVSVDTLSDAIGHHFSVGPPVSLHNPRRSAYISRHRRDSSTDSTVGRAEWAAHHRRNSSIASTTSNFSVSQLARPGLGDRMFQLDGGVQLTSITGSPPDEPAHSARPASHPHHRQPSWDSLFDGTHSKMEDSLFDNPQHVNDSLFDSDTSANRSSGDSDSLFGPEHHAATRNFFLKGLRPISTISTTTNGSGADDTFVHVQNYLQNVTTPLRTARKDIEMCLQGDGEDLSTMTPLGKCKQSQSITGRQMLGSSMSRPQKPGRRRPAHLIITEPPLDTPGLTSPSASETSSRLSLDTNAASITLGTRVRPAGAGHYRQKSSAGVKVEATIHEMPSIATLRANKPSASPGGRSHSVTSREPTIVGVDELGEEEEIDRMRSVRNWVEWEREAVDEFRKAKSCWRDSEESKHILEDWKMPKTKAEIAAFLAQSTQAYKPLSQLPVGKIAHRRKSSLSDSRSLCSPYGLPLPKPPPANKPKMSLTTKYEKKNSTSSTASAVSTFAFAFPDDVPEAPAAPPLSAVFAPFARETPPPPPPGLSPFKSVSPLHWPALDAFGLKKQLEESAHRAGEGEKQKRSRVTSSARRQALGWGRRRNSDGPERTIGVGMNREPMPPVPATAVPLQLRTTFALPSNRGHEAGGGAKSATNGKGKMNIFADFAPNEQTIRLGSSAYPENGNEDSVTDQEEGTETGG
ncbi:hypothetical protein I317_07096 [Kwoniella heveanensis CBS 569]|nr:hypothetical protein I317_07096 [Kwoniella heveanensis CBS 569]